MFQYRTLQELHHHEISSIEFGDDGGVESAMARLQAHHFGQECLELFIGFRKDPYGWCPDSKPSSQSTTEHLCADGDRHDGHGHGHGQSWAWTRGWGWGWGMIFAEDDNTSAASSDEAFTTTAPSGVSTKKTPWEPSSDFCTPVA